MNIPFRSALIAATILSMTLAIAPQGTRAQTPAQMEYERQQREYWRQQEQQHQQQLMNENARRQQEESSRINAPTGQSPTPGYQGAAPQRGSGQSGAQALEEARKRWSKRPPLPPERNPLLGRWTRPPTRGGNSSDPFAALQALAKGGLCEVLFGGGTFEFRPTTLVGFDKRTSPQELDQVEYRGDAKQVVVIPKTTVKLIVFDFDGPDRINWSGQN